MKDKILICLDLLKYPYSGMGRVSSDFSATIDALNENDLELSYLIPSSYKTSCNLSGEIVVLNFFRKVISTYMQEFEICHVMHQLPKFSFKRARKVVLTIHDLNFLYVKNQQKQVKYRRIVQNAINKADYICFISNFVKEDCFNHMRIDADKPVKVIYNGVNDLPAPSKKPEWCPCGSFIFSIGQFLFKKNFQVLIPFLKLLPNSVSLVIAGDHQTSYGRQIQQIVKDENLEDRVILPGTVSEEVKSYLYNNCTAFVFPSIAEGFGLPVIEAMKCNKPVFCSDKTSLKEIGNRYAFFWNDFNPMNMMEVFNSGITEFENDAKRKVDQKKYADSFTWKKNVKEYINVYNELLER